MKHNSMKLRIINLIQRQNAVQNIVQSIAQNRETTILKTENPATIPHDQARTNSRDIYMFVSQKNKLIGNAFPDGDVLHIKDIFPDGDVLHIKKITGGTAHGSI